jgi:ribosomal protein S27AE
MDVCPKCSGYRIVGPHYENNWRLGEILRYRCAQCNYSETQPCHDAKSSHRLPPGDQP